MSIKELQEKVLGKQIEFHSYGSGSFAQCVDLINFYINTVLDSHTKDYTEIIGTNAKDFNTKYDTDDFEWIANTPSGVPQEGDIVVWNGKVGGGAGHVAIFLEGDTKSFKSLDQNWSQKERVTLETHNYTNVSGWLRPKNFEEKISISQADLDLLRKERDDNWNNLQAEKKSHDKTKADLKVEEERTDDLLKQLKKYSEEDKNTSEELHKAQKAIEPLESTLQSIRIELGVNDNSQIIEALKTLKNSKVKYQDISKLSFFERLIFLLGGEKK